MRCSTCLLLLCILSGAAPRLAPAADVHALATADPHARETAIRQIIADRAHQQSAVVELFATGDLAARVNALEVLQAWNAPTAGLDPWQPATITPGRLRALRTWAATPPAITTQPATLTASERAETREELHRLLSLPPDADVIRLRLARIGQPLLPELLPLFADNTLSDAQRRQLYALKYQALASPALLARWPNGPVRITSSDRTTRNAAANELAGVVSDADAPLLLQLFTDPDPLVRELSLKALKRINGQQSSKAIAGLLKDPDLNVRAAVLKELADSPSRNLIPALVAYIHSETDEDLLAQAIRTLRAAYSDGSSWQQPPSQPKEGVDCLLALLTHPAWRIRAAAAEGLPAMRSSNDAAQTARITTALTRLLNDPDSFVVSRAVLAFQKIPPPPGTIDALIHTSNLYPELTPDVLNALTSENATVSAAFPKLKTFARNPNPAIRAQVITAAGEAMGLNARTIILPALSDPDATVRIAAADVYRKALWALLPTDGKVQQRGWFSQSSVKVDTGKWLASFRSGKLRPRWLDEAKPQLIAMGRSKDLHEQASVAALNLALDQNDPVDTLLDAPAAWTDDDVERIANCFPWLPADRRQKLLNHLLAHSPSDWSRSRLLEGLTRIPDARILDEIWEFTASDTKFEAIDSAERALNQHYFGESWYYHSDGEPADPRVPQVVKDMLPYARTGTEPQRLLAIAMLVSCSPPDGLKVAHELVDDPTAPAGTRRDAFQALLLASPPAEATRLALQNITKPDRRTLCVRFLAEGPDAISWLRDTISISNINFRQTPWSNNNADAPRHFYPPKGLTRQPLEPLLHSPDATVRADAAYLLCLLGDRDALDPLRAALAEKDNAASASLLYRTISSFNDDSLTPELEKIYSQFSRADRSRQWEIRDFYWTIRVVNGPRALRLRQKIRNEVGMKNLL